MDYLRIYPNYDSRAASDEVALVCPEDTLTVQSSKDDADINVLVRRFGLTGQLPQVQVPPSFQDFDAVFDYQSAQNLILAANRSFAAMPADVRSRFGNNPEAFVRFCDDPANLDEMRKLGLAVPKAPVEPVPAPGDTPRPVEVEAPRGAF